MTISPQSGVTPAPTTQTFPTNYSSGHLAGMSPTDHDIDQARRALMAAYLIFGVGAGGLLSAVAIRFYSAAHRLPDLASAAWVYGVFVAAALAVATWVTVELHSHGSEFGDLLAAERRADTEADQLDRNHDTQIRAALDTARDQTNYGRRALTDHQAQIVDNVAAFTAGLQLSAAVLRCQMPSVNRSALIELDRTKTDRIEHELDEQDTRTTELETDADVSHLPQSPTWESPYSSMHTPPTLAPNPNHVGPGVPSAFSYGPSSLGTP